MDNKEFGSILEERTRKFAVEIIRFSTGLPDTPEWKVIRNQISKAGTSIGANYHEANRSRSIAEFISKIKLCAGEANEVVFWINLIQNLKPTDRKVPLIQSEVNELLAIFTSIIHTSKLKKNGEL
jgi:four helix bundle protein